MKKILLFLVALVCATVSFAQKTLVATLTHGDDIKIFYGADSYKNAMNAAVAGDVINLSGGKFNPAPITKAVTIRGTGVKESNPTIVDGLFEVKVPASDSQRLTMEGIRFSGQMYIRDFTTNPYFVKCYFDRVQIEGETRRIMFVSCEIRGDLYTSVNTTSQFISCYIVNPRTYSKLSTEFINCVLNFTVDIAKSVENSNIVNCIIVKGSTSYYSLSSFPVTTIPVNCISVGYGNPFSNTTGTDNISGLPQSIFVNSDIRQDLTDEAKAKYLGYDGTPVGMYGGAMPRNMVPSYPRITKMNVAKQTTPDGKLSVDIEVSAAE